MSTGTELARIELHPDPAITLVADVVRGTDRGRFTWLFLHGFGSNRAGDKARMVLDVARRRGDAALSVDQRFHGDSTGELAQIRLEPMIDDATWLLENVHAHTGYPRAHPIVLVASSLGGLVAVAAAARNPAPIGFVQLIAPGFEWSSRLLESPRDDDGLLQVASDWLDVRLDPDVVEHTARALDEQAIARSTTATLRIHHGSADPVVPIAASRRWLAGVPDSTRTELVELDGGDHRLTDHMPRILADLEATLDRAG